MLSDNAPCFAVTAKALRHQYPGNFPEWRFITEYAPWRGGTHERLIALVKKCLRATLKTRLLPTNQWITAHAEVERVVNSRPISAIMSDDIIRPLRPIDFISPGAGLATNPSFPPEKKNLDCLADPDYFYRPPTANELRLKHEANNRLLEKFTITFKNQYLLNLRERHKGNPKQTETFPSINDIVLIKDEHHPIFWRLGRIEALITSADGQTRTALVKTPIANKKDAEGKAKLSTVKRAITQLYPLEFATKAEGNECSLAEQNINVSTTMIATTTLQSTSGNQLAQPIQFHSSLPILQSHPSNAQLHNDHDLIDLTTEIDFCSAKPIEVHSTPLTPRTKLKALLGSQLEPPLFRTSLLYNNLEFQDTSEIEIEKLFSKFVIDNSTPSTPSSTSDMAPREPRRRPGESDERSYFRWIHISETTDQRTTRTLDFNYRLPVSKETTLIRWAQDLKIVSDKGNYLYRKDINDLQINTLMQLLVFQRINEVARKCKAEQVQEYYSVTNDILRTFARQPTATYRILSQHHRMFLADQSKNTFTNDACKMIATHWLHRCQQLRDEINNLNRNNQPIFIAAQQATNFCCGEMEHEFKMAFGYAGTRIMKVIAQVQYQIHWQTAQPPHPFVGAEFLMIHNNGTKFNAVKNWKRIFHFETWNATTLKDALSDIFLFWTCKQTYIWI